MSSILTNNSAMVALATLRTINMDLAKTQDEISTGKSIATAKDNSAIWAISKVMESDVKAFNAISDSLSLGDSTVGVARQASETVTDLLTQVKQKIVAAQEDNVDRTKLQADITQLRNQITSVVDAAQFNGLNLVNGSQGASLDILSSLDRASSVVTASEIQVGLTGSDLSETTGTALTAVTDVASIADAANATITFASINFNNGAGTAADGDFAPPLDTLGDPDAGAFLQVGDVVELEIGGVSASYAIRAGDGGEAVLTQLREQLINKGLTDEITLTVNAANLQIDNNTGAAVDPSFTATRGAGGLSSLAGLTVNGTEQQRSDALGDIEDMIQYAVDAAANFGSAQGRIETQISFVSGLTDSLKSGIGSLVDADMEAASARLQALQVQQQLGVQALSIANQAPQTILSLFR